MRDTTEPPWPPPSYQRTVEIECECEAIARTLCINLCDSDALYKGNRVRFVTRTNDWPLLVTIAMLGGSVLKIRNIVSRTTPREQTQFARRLVSTVRRRGDVWIVREVSFRNVEPEHKGRLPIPCKRSLN